MRTTPIKTRLAQAQRVGRRCEIPGCYLPRQKFGRYCEAHDQVMQRTGDPKGRTVRRGEFEPFITAARQYFIKFQDHPEIAKRIRWIERLIWEAGPAPGRITPKSSAHDRLRLWVDQMRRQELPPIEILSMVVALYAFREWTPRAFRSDRHFKHQLAIRVLRMVRTPRIVSRRGTEYLGYVRITVGVRALLGDALHLQLGTLGFAVGRKLTKKLETDPSAQRDQLNNLLQE